MIHPHRITATPFSSSTIIIFPYDPETRQFSTDGYRPIQTHNRLSLQEARHFLHQVNIPIKKWHEDYDHLSRESFGFCCVFILCFFFLPLIFCLLCWLSMMQAKAREDMREAMEKSITFVRENNSHFASRGLMWNVPAYFPQWIELWINVPGRQGQAVHIPIEPIQGIPIMPQRKPEIHTISMPQQEYENIGVPVNQEEYYSNVQEGQLYVEDMYSSKV